MQLYKNSHSNLHNLYKHSIDMKSFGKLRRRGQKILCIYCDNMLIVYFYVKFFICIIISFRMAIWQTHSVLELKALCKPIKILCTGFSCMVPLILHLLSIMLPSNDCIILVFCNICYNFFCILVVYNYYYLVLVLLIYLNTLS